MSDSRAYYLISTNTNRRLRKLKPPGRSVQFIQRHPLSKDASIAKLLSPTRRSDHFAGRLGRREDFNLKLMLDSRAFMKRMANTQKRSLNIARRSNNFPILSR